MVRVGHQGQEFNEWHDGRYDECPRCHPEFREEKAQTYEMVGGDTGDGGPVHDSEENIRTRPARHRAFIGEKEIVRVLESFNGDLYFIAEEDGDEVFGYVRLYAMPECAEWGYSSLENLRRSYGANMIWDVKNRNWPNLPSYNVESLRIEEASFRVV